jgi:hypothetical protein
MTYLLYSFSPISVNCQLIYYGTNIIGSFILELSCLRGHIDSVSCHLLLDNDSFAFGADDRLQVHSIITIVIDWMA